MRVGVPVDPTDFLPRRISAMNLSPQVFDQSLGVLKCSGANDAKFGAFNLEELGAPVKTSAVRLSDGRRGGVEVGVAVKDKRDV